ncbi:MAG: isocitrate/isopropylmalate dehydrogenase family protein [Candidatus Helarchaeota archaeon]
MKKIVVIPGNGIGPEIILPITGLLTSLGSYECIVFEEIKDIADHRRATKKLLEFYETYVGNEPKYSKSHWARFNILDGLIKNYLFSKDISHQADYLEYKYSAISQGLKDSVKESAACLFGSIQDFNGGYLLFWFRQGLELFANIRPAKCYPNIPCYRKNIDLTIIRENTEGLYAGLEFQKKDAVLAVKRLTWMGVERILKYAFNFTKDRKSQGTKGELICVDKANALPICDGYFRFTFKSIAKQYPSINTQEWFVDRAAMELIRAPEAIDVMVMPNLYGDILSDEAAALVGGLGITPSAEIGNNYGLFQPVSGTAPDIAGKNIANPLSALFSTVLLLKYIQEPKCAEALESAILKYLQVAEGFTPDLGGTGTTSGVFSQIQKFL